MAVLFTSGSTEVPVEAFFYRTPPRKVVGGMTSEQVITFLQGGQCKYALVPTPPAVPQGLEIRAVRMGWALLQRKGQITRSDRRRILVSQAANCRLSIW